MDRLHPDYRLLFDANPNPMWVFDEETLRFLAVNDAAVRQYGWSREEFLELTILDVRRPEEREKARDAIRQQRGARAVTIGVFRHCRKDGAPLDMEVTVSSIDFAGRPARLCLMTNVTERMRVEQLRVRDLDAMERLRRLGTLSVREGGLQPILTEIVDTAIAITNADFGNIQLLAPATGDLRIAAHRGFPPWWLDFWNSVAKGRGCCGTALQRGERVIVEDVEQSPIFAGTEALEIQRRAGVRAVQSTPLIGRSGKPVGMFSTHYRTPRRPDEHALRLLDLLAAQAADMIDHARSDEALRLSEERLKLAQLSAGAGMWDWDIPSGTLEWSEALYRLFGLDPREAGAGFDMWKSVVHPEDRAAAAARIDEAIRAKTPLDSEYRITRPSGEIRWIRALGNTVYAHGEPLRMSGICLDVTSRKQAEQELDRARSMLAEAQKIAHLGSFEYVAASRTTVWSEEEFRIYGLDPRGPSPAYEEMLARCIHPDDAALLHETFTKAMQGRSVYELEHRIVRPDGEVRWVHDRAQPYFDEQGALLRYVGATLDITERKQAEVALQQSEGRERARAAELAAVLDAAPTPIFIAHDAACQHITGNRAADEMLRNPSCGEASLSAPETVRPRHFKAVRDGIELPLAELPAQRAARGERVLDFEFSLVFDDGAVRHVLGNGTPLPDAEGRPRGSVLILTDITERKQADERLRASTERLRLATQAAALGVLEVDLVNDRGVWENQRMFDLFGRTREDGPLNRAQLIAEAMHPDDVAAFERDTAAGASTGEPFRACFRIRRKNDGAWRWIESSVCVVCDATGRPQRLIGVSADITARKEAEETLRANESRQKAADAVATEWQRFRRSLDQLPAYLVLLSPDYRVPFANRFFEERFGKSGGKRCYEYLFNRTAPCENCQSYTPMKTGRLHRWEWVGPDGRTYDVHDLPFTDHDGSPMVMEVGLDVTDIRQAERALKEMNATLEQRVSERTAQLSARNAELTEFNNLMVDRELRMIELKREINEFCLKAGHPPRYAVDGGEGAV